MSDKVTAGHMDERFDEVKAELQQIHKKIDTNARAAEARFHVLESRLPGHSDDQIIELIDARLQAVLPGMLREAVADELRGPLTRVEEAIRSSHANHAAIETLQADVTTVKASTTPIVEIVDGLQFIRRFLIGTGGLAGSGLVIWAALSGILS